MCVRLADRRKQKLFYLGIKQMRFLITENYHEIPVRPFLQSHFFRVEL